jgi:hypothetical protein
MTFEELDRRAWEYYVNYHKKDQAQAWLARMLEKEHHIIGPPRLSDVFKSRHLMNALAVGLLLCGTWYISIPSVVAAIFQLMNDWGIYSEEIWVSIDRLFWMIRVVGGVLAFLMGTELGLTASLYKHLPFLAFIMGVFNRTGVLIVGVGSKPKRESTKRDQYVVAYVRHLIDDAVKAYRERNSEEFLDQINSQLKELKKQRAMIKRRLRNNRQPAAHITASLARVEQSIARLDAGRIARLEADSQIAAFVEDSEAILSDLRMGLRDLDMCLSAHSSADEASRIVQRVMQTLTESLAEITSRQEILTGELCETRAGMDVALALAAGSSGDIPADLATIEAVLTEADARRAAPATPDASTAEHIQPMPDPAPLASQAEQAREEEVEVSVTR